MTGLRAIANSLGPADLLAIGVGGMAFVVVLALAVGVFRRDPLAARIRAVAQPEAARAAGLTGNSARGGPGADGARNLIEMMRRVVGRLDLLRSRQAEAIGGKLACAGWRSKDALVIYLFAKLALPLVSGCVGAGALFALPDIEVPLLPALAALMAGVLGASYAPDLVVRRRSAKRRKAIGRALPDALDLLVICAEAGLSLDAALVRVTREIAPSAPALADEFGLASFELGFLPDRRAAFDNLARRIDLAAIRSLTSTLQQTEKFGTPLAASLRVIAAELRNARMMAAEAKAARLPVIMTVPLIIFVLPALFVVVMGPGILDIIDAFSRM